MNRLKGKVVLVTGGAGFIGSQLAARLSAVDDIRLLVLTRKNRSALEEGPEWLTAELGSLTKEFWKSKGIEKIDYVFHLGAFIPKSGADSNNIARATNDNIEGTRVLLVNLPGSPEKVVFASTVDVYASSSEGGVLSERSRVGPVGLYGASKLFCESLISAWGQQHSIDYSILRYGHIYGPGEERYKKLIPTVIRGLLKNQGPTIYGDGSALRDFLYVGDAVEATIRAALISDICAPINVVRGESVSVKELVSLLMSLFEFRRDIEFKLDQPGGESFRFDNAFMKACLGNWPMTSLEKGLSVEVEAFRRLNR